MLRYCVCASLCLGWAALAVAQGSAASPRTGTVYELRVAWAGPDTLSRLDAGGYNIDHVHPGMSVEVYATPAERERLIADGFVIETTALQGASGSPSEGAKALGTYSTYTSLTADLQAYAAAHTDIARLYTLGQSVQGRELWALLITDNPDIEEPEPEFKWVSTMHGDEPLGTEMCRYMIDRLLNDYGLDGRITDLVNSTAIWFVPLMNPDGLQLGTRNNASGFDLNRNFPQYPFNFVETYYDGEPLNAEAYPAEIRHIMEWAAANSFTLAANLHGGALVVNYPYDYAEGIPSGMDAPSPDDLLFEDVSLRYSINNGPMYASFAFPDGITNGSDWFAITGGMQDWNYRFLGIPAVLMELSNSKKPGQSTIPTFWSQNEESMLQFMEAAHIGVRGIVRDINNATPLYAKVRVVGNAQPAFTDPDVGDYHRLLLPGTYTLEISVPGYYPESVVVTVGSGAATVANVSMTPIQLGLRPWSVFAALLLLGALSALGVRRARCV